MADDCMDGLCLLGGAETKCLVKSSVKSDEKMKNVEQPECGNNVASVCGPIGPAETQKSSINSVDKKCVSVTDTTNNKCDGLTVNRCANKQKTPGLVGLPRANVKQLKDMKMSTEDTREKRRCTDRYDPSESSDSENLFRTMADLVVSEGYAALGYEYINVDDCWLEKSRGPQGQLVADRKRFPRGMRSLSDYVHSKGLKFGIYEDYGNYTCAGYPGIIGYARSDAQQFADWNVDYVKLDGCYSLPLDMDQGYPEFGRHLNGTGRQMVYSCSWPVYQIYAGISPNFSSIIEHCNLWRNYDDIQDSWASLETIIDYYGNNQDAIVPNASPGHWNDPDMLIIGNFGLSYDLRTIRPEFKAILQNQKIIAVDQDPLGIQGRRIYKHKGIEIWSRPITPIYQTYYSYAVAFVNRRTDGTPSDVAVTLRELGLQSPTGYRVEDLYEDVNYGILSPNTKIKVKVNPSGVVILSAHVQPERITRTTYNPLNYYHVK